MSGGVDSSVTAALLKSQGYDVLGMTLQLYDDGAMRGRIGACCAGQDIHDARRVADQIGVPHYVLDFENRFRENVIDDFIDSYLAGETPIPCVRCNQTVKFRDLLTRARDLGADALATGHYVQRIMGKNGAELHRGVDPKRDQSYFLFATTAEQLDFLRFPLGDIAKDETRRIAEQLGLTVAMKPDSQDICFVPDGKYAAVIEKLRPGAATPGDIVHVDGRKLGRHDGIVNFTIGQRRGIGIGGGDPVFVVRLDADSATVIVGPREALAISGISIRDLNWLGGDLDAGEGEAVPISVQYRSTQVAIAGWLKIDGERKARIEFGAPEYGVSPGQACVFYQGNRVLGGGWINGTDPAHLSTTESATGTSSDAGARGEGDAAGSDKHSTALA